MIIELKEWPNFTWDASALVAILPECRYQQGHLLGYMETLSADLRAEASATILAADIAKSSEIAGTDFPVGNLSQMTLDAVTHYHQPLTITRLSTWQSQLFPHSAVYLNTNLALELARFLKWFNAPSQTDLLVKAAVAHFWFLTLRPFAEVSGVMARVVTLLMLGRADKCAHRFYSLSAQLCRERDTYHELFANAEQQSLDVTGWIVWFLSCLKRAILASRESLQPVISKARFWERHVQQIFNERQLLMMQAFLNNQIENCNTSLWAQLTASSQDTALRDITDLVQRGILHKEPAGGRSTRYHLMI